jgi:cysteine desulfurase
MDPIYLDNNATTRPAPEVVDAVGRAMREQWANPSSVHRPGQAVRQKVELARQSVAQLLNAKPNELIFTSGGTESDNLAVRGLLDRAQNPVLITTKLEHSALREPAEALSERGQRVVYVPSDGDGRIAPQAVADTVAQHAADADVVLVSIQWANNETGVIQPIDAIAQAVKDAAGALDPARRTKVYFHTDATQAVGKLPVDVAAAGVDLLTFAGHKFHGPKGIGGLWRRRGVRLTPLQRGGPQEREQRGGTENTAGIIGLGVAAELAQAFVNDASRLAELTARRDRFERGVQAAYPETVVNSAGAPRLWNTSNLGFPGLEAEAILVGLSERGVCASAGAACSSGSLEPSPVLRAMGVPERVAHGSVRFSLSRDSTDAEIEQALAVVPMVLERLARTLPV